jgi:hypothetical protein
MQDNTYQDNVHTAGTAPAGTATKYHFKVGQN